MKEFAKKFILICVFTLAIGNITLNVEAETQLQGNGSEKSPFLITSVEDFVIFQENVNNGITYENMYILQLVDLDLKDIENWIPIGIFDSGNYFAGTYNGNGHTIKNLNMKREDNCGLFGQLAGTIINLGIESGNISGQCVGSIASHSFGTNAAIINCYNKANVRGTVRAGGIVDNFDGKVYNSWNIGKVSAATETIGGIASYNVLDCQKCYSNSFPLIQTNTSTGNTENVSLLNEDEIKSEKFAKTLNYNNYKIIDSYPQYNRVLFWIYNGELIFTEKKPIIYYWVAYKNVLIPAILVIFIIYFSIRVLYLFMKDKENKS